MQAEPPRFMDSFPGNVDIKRLQKDIPKPLNYLRVQRRPGGEISLAGFDLQRNTKKLDIRLLNVFFIL